MTRALALLLLLALSGCVNPGGLYYAFCKSDTGIGMAIDYYICGER